MLSLWSVRMVCVWITGRKDSCCLTDKNTKVMKILNEEHFENVKHYAESIGDTSLQKCLERLKSWEGNPDYPCEISLYYDHAPENGYLYSKK